MIETSIFFACFILLVRTVLFITRRKYNNDEALRKYHKAAKRLEKIEVHKAR